MTAQRHPSMANLTVDPDDITTTSLGKPMTGVTSEFTPYVPWIRAHLTRGRTLRSYDTRDYPFPAETLEWIYQSGLFRPEENERLQAYGIPLLCSVWLHHEDPEVMEMNLRSMTWISSFDDKILEVGRARDAYIEQCPEVLRTGRLPATADLFHRSLRDIHDHLVDRGAAAILPELAARYHDWLTACDLEQHWRSTGTIPTVGEYLANRQASIGAYPVHVFIRLQSGMVPPGEPVSPAIARLRLLAVQLIGLENDLYSAHKEASDGTGMTLVEVIEHNYGVDTPNALAAGLAISNALRVQHDRLVADILNDPRESTQARRFTQRLATVVDGQLEWAFAALRYGVLDFSANGMDLAMPWKTRPKI